MIWFTVLPAETTEDAIAFAMTKQKRKMQQQRIVIKFFLLFLKKIGIKSWKSLPKVYTILMYDKKLQTMREIVGKMFAKKSKEEL